MKKYLSYLTIIALAVALMLAAPASAKDYRLVKTADRAEVYLVKQNRRVHIPNEEVFEAGGYDWYDIETISYTDMQRIPNTAMIKSPIDAKVYLIHDGQKSHIPDEETFLGTGFAWTDIITISESQVRFYETKDFDQEEADVAHEETTKQKEQISSDASYKRPTTANITNLGSRSYDGIGINYANLKSNGGIVLSEYDASTLRENGIDTELSKNQITVYAENGEYIELENNRTFRYVDGNTNAPLPTLGGSSVVPYDVNSIGQFVGYSEVSGSGGDSGEKHAFLFEHGNMKDLGLMGGIQSRAIAINVQGQIVGNIDDEQYKDKAFIWKNGEYEFLEGLDAGETRVSDINDNGIIIGSAAEITNECPQEYCFRPVYWENNKLHTFRIDFTPKKINNVNEVIGTVVDNNTAEYVRNQYGDNMTEALDNLTEYISGYAALYKDGTITRLDDLIEEKHIILTDVLQINDRGQILAYGFDLENPGMNVYLVELSEKN